MEDKLVTLRKYLKQLRDTYLGALHSFYVYKTIQEARTQKFVGQKEAEDNFKTILRFNHFFLTVKQATNFHFLVELAKFLEEKNNQALSLKKLINFANSNNILTKNKIKELDKKFEEMSGIRKKIKDHRDEKLAHEDFKKQTIRISQEEIITTFDFIEEVLNIFSKEINLPAICRIHIENKCKKDTQNVIKYLKKLIVQNKKRELRIV